MASFLKIFALSLLPKGSIIWKKRDSHIYLTFDDGPHPNNTPRLLNILKEYGIKASFFVQGEHIFKYPDIARQVAEEGHTIAGHSWSHRRLSQWAFREAWTEFDRTKTVIREITGVETIWYRPPFGWITIPMLIYAAIGRMKLIMWSVDSNDDRTRTVAAILSKGRDAQGGDIFLCHDDNEAILQALPTLVHEWQTRGLNPRALEDDG